MAGIGERMSGRNSTVTGADGRMYYGDGTPVPPDVQRRFERREKAWARWERGEKVSGAELAGDAPNDDV